MKRTKVRNKTREYRTQKSNRKRKTKMKKKKMDVLLHDIFCENKK